MGKPIRFWAKPLASLGFVRRKGKRAAENTHNRRHLTIEPLEPRQMLSGGTADDPVGLAQFLGQGAIVAASADTGDTAQLSSASASDAQTADGTDDPASLQSFLGTAQPMVPGTSLYFDPGQSGHSNNGATASGCAGNPSLNVWNATATDWYNPQTNSDVAWASGKAYFEGAGGTVTVSGTFSTLGMTIAPTSGAYTLTGGTIGLSTNTLSVTGSAAIGSGLTGSNCGVTMHGGGTLILSGTDSFSTTWRNVGFGRHA